MSEGTETDSCEDIKSIALSFSAADDEVKRLELELMAARTRRNVARVNMLSTLDSYDE